VLQIFISVLNFSLVSALTDQDARMRGRFRFDSTQAIVMDVIETHARISVARGCAFALLAIFCVMFGLLGTPVLALKIGGLFCLVVSIILMLRAEFAHLRSHKHTEVWLMLDEGDRPPSAIAQQVICGVLRGVYNEFALYFARGAAWTLGVGFVLDILRLSGA
jgi:hypothetical protein